MVQRTERRVCVGKIVGAHGVRGLLRLKSYTEHPESIAAYGPVEDELGNFRSKLKLLSRAGDAWIASVAGVNDRTAAEALKGRELFVDRSQLPPPDDDEFYYEDLVGVTAERADDGEKLGIVAGVHDYGGGTFLDLRLMESGRSVAVPFTRAVVPEIDLDHQRLVVAPPEGLFDLPEPPPGGHEEEGGSTA